MDYTNSDATVTHSSGRRMHQDTLPVTSAVQPRDLNMILWSLNHLREAAGVAAVGFNPDDPNTFNRITAAVQAIATGVGSISIANFTGSNQALTTAGWQKLPGGLILQWVQGATVATEGTQTLGLPMTFPNAILNALVSTDYPSGDTAGDAYFQIAAKSTSLLTLLAQSPTTFNFGPMYPTVLAIGF